MLIEDTLEICTYSKYQEPELGFLFGIRCANFAEKWSLRHYQLCTADEEKLFLIKTHEAPLDNNPCIYLIRDGRNAISGLARFWGKAVHKIITGEESSPFMDWTTHYRVWRPYERPQTLIVHFEDMVKQPDAEAARISEYINMPVKKQFDNPQKECRKHWPQLFKPRHSDYKIDFTEFDTELFWQLHEDTMIATGYGSREEDENAGKV